MSKENAECPLKPTVCIDRLLHPAPDEAALACGEECRRRLQELHGASLETFVQAHWAKARRTIADCIEARPEEILFRRGVVDANRCVIDKFAGYAPLRYSAG